MVLENDLRVADLGDERVKWWLKDGTRAAVVIPDVVLVLIEVVVVIDLIEEGSDRLIEEVARENCMRRIGADTFFGLGTEENFYRI